MLFNSHSTLGWVALATLLGSFDIVNAGFGSSRMQLKSRHQDLHARHDAVVEKRTPEAVPVLEEKNVQVRNRKRSTKKCPPKGGNTPSANVAMAPNTQSSSSQSRLDKIKSMYAYEGFVYPVDACPSKSTLQKDFSNMVNKYKARTVITFGHCQSGGFYSNVIGAADSANINLILLADTLVQGSYGSGSVSSTINNIVGAIKENPGPVIAMAIGDEPAYDSDLGGVSGIVSKINSVRGQFKDAGIDMPISISDMAFGYQSAGQKSASDPLPKAVDFFMINTFPYFASGATSGGSDGAWKSFTTDIAFFEKIANGKPLLVTQTGWASQGGEFAPNSGSIQVSKSSEEAYWNLLDSHCKDFFKPKNLGYMWRSYNEGITGWGFLDGSGSPKFSISGTKTTC